MNIINVRDVVKKALSEDIGFGDITSLIIDSSKKGRGYFLAKEDLVLCGAEVATFCFKELDEKIKVFFTFKDGDFIKKGTEFGTVEGSLRMILTGERVALNFLQRLSGIATITREFVSKVEKYGVKILDTRKTTPLLRELEKFAVKTGGGQNHRFNLSDGVLIKDNHIVAAKGITNAVNEARKSIPALTKIAVEVKSIKELKEALKAKVDHIMLDNMSPLKVAKALSIIKGAVPVEVSGGITLENIEEYAKLEPDYISLGCITHSVKAVDISLELEK
ncbi:MAG: carboxylating nicotinate-nucleotide diphosphorylase [bacterium]